MKTAEIYVRKEAEVLTFPPEIWKPKITSMLAKIYVRTTEMRAREDEAEIGSRMNEIGDMCFKKACVKKHGKEEGFGVIQVVKLGSTKSFIFSP